MALGKSRSCDYQGEGPLHDAFHDTEYGFPVDSDEALFEHLVLAINTAGMSWDMVLNKRENFRKAYRGYDIAKVAKFNDFDLERLVNDAGIIRNPRKIGAAIENAKRIQTLQKEHGSFQAWLASQHPKTDDEWATLFGKTFSFAGPGVTHNFLRGTGWLPGAHSKGCPVLAKVKKAGAPWATKK